MKKMRKAIGLILTRKNYVSHKQMFLVIQPPQPKVFLSASMPEKASHGVPNRPKAHCNMLLGRLGRLFPTRRAEGRRTGFTLFLGVKTEQISHQKICYRRPMSNNTYPPIDQALLARLTKLLKERSTPVSLRDLSVGHRIKSDRVGTLVAQ
jgi:hypothetical protein